MDSPAEILERSTDSFVAYMRRLYFSSVRHTCSIISDTLLVCHSAQFLRTLNLIYQH